MTKRLDYHLTHNVDKLMIDQTKNRYDLMSEERKSYIRTLIVSTPNTCSGRTRLDKHRIWIELLVYDFIFKDNCCEIDDYSKDDIEDVCIVWFFEKWMTDIHYNFDDY